MLWARILADVVAVVHATWVGFIVFGQILILVGLARGWGWVRHPGFRLIHLAMIGYVVFEAAVGLDCPLTVWESRLRRLGGGQEYAADFVGYWAHRLIFVEAPPWVFSVVYAMFGTLVLATFVLAPPRWSRTGPLAAAGSRLQNEPPPAAASTDPTSGPAHQEMPDS